MAISTVRATCHGNSLVVYYTPLRLLFLSVYLLSLGSSPFIFSCQCVCFLLTTSFLPLSGELAFFSRGD